jgi:hypothetical protein
MMERRQKTRQDLDNKARQAKPRQRQDEAKTHRQIQRKGQDMIRQDKNKTRRDNTTPTTKQDKDKTRQRQDKTWTKC